MTGEPLLIIGAVNASLQTLQVVFVSNRLVNGILAAAIAGLGFVLARGKVTPASEKEQLP